MKQEELQPEQPHSSLSLSLALALSLSLSVCARLSALAHSACPLFLLLLLLRSFLLVAALLFSLSSSFRSSSSSSSSLLSPVFSVQFLFFLHPADFFLRLPGEDSQRAETLS